MLKIEKLFEEQIKEWHRTNRDDKLCYFIGYVYNENLNEYGIHTIGVKVFRTSTANLHLLEDKWYAHPTEAMTTKTMPRLVSKEVTLSC